MKPTGCIVMADDYEDEHLSPTIFAHEGESGRCYGCGKRWGTFSVADVDEDALAAWMQGLVPQTYGDPDGTCVEQYADGVAQ